MENKLEHVYGRSGLVFLQEGAGQATRVAHFYARPAGGAASKAGPSQVQECFMAAGKSFRGQERKTDGCQTGNRRAPAEGVGIRKRLWRRYGRNDRGWGHGGGNGGEEYSPKKPISCNDEPSSDAPQTKQTKQPIRLIVRDIPRLNVCVCARR